MGYAGNYRYFTYASWVLSGASALVALVPFVYIWKILRDVLDAAPNYAQAVNIPHYGWQHGSNVTYRGAACEFSMQDASALRSA